MIWQWQREKKFLKLTTLFPPAAEDPGNEWSGKSKEPKAWGGQRCWVGSHVLTCMGAAVLLHRSHLCHQNYLPWALLDKNRVRNCKFLNPSTWNMLLHQHDSYRKADTEHSWIFFRKSQECEHWEGMGHRCLRSWTQGKTGPQNIKSFQSLDLVVNANTVSRFRPALMKRFSPANLELDDTQKAYHFHPRIDLVTRIYLN